MNISNFANHCCGCGGCSIICPNNAITMKKNNQDFYYPSVDTSSCIGCGECVNHCSFNHNGLVHPINQEAYAVKHKDNEIRMASRSGGMFFTLVEEILNRNGVIYGCKLVNNNEAVHFRATTKEECELMHGSKYIQSSIINCYKSIKEDLNKNLWVLFSGTACQVNAIKNYCSDVDCSKLLLVDIVCHGASSSRVWKDYLEYISKKNKKSIKAVDFRDKQSFGWTAHIESFKFKDNSTYSCDYYKTLFYSHLILRDDCFDCPYKNLDRQGDITLADCWGITTNEPEFDDDKGVSLVLVNSDKGRKFFEITKSQINYLKVNVQDYLQPPLNENWPKPNSYEKFWENYNQLSFNKILDKYIPKQPKESFVQTGINKCRRIAKKATKLIIKK